MGIRRFLQQQNQLGDPLNTGPGQTNTSIMGNIPGLGGNVAEVSSPNVTPVIPEVIPPRIPVAHKSSTRAGGLRDITREAVRPSAPGSQFSLASFYPDYLNDD